MRVLEFGKLVFRKAKLKTKWAILRLPIPGLRRMVVLWDRMGAAERSLAEFRKATQTKLRLQEDRLGKKIGELQARIESFGQSRPIDALSASTAPTPSDGLSSREIEFLFAHSRLPAPPAVILDRANVLSAGGIDFKSLGYRIVVNSSSEFETAFAIAIDRLDARTNWEQPLLLRSAKPGCRHIFCLELADPAAHDLIRQLARLKDYVAGFRIKELVVAKRNAAVWTFAADLQNAQIKLENHRGETVVLAVVEKD